MKTRHGIKFLFVLAMVATFFWVKPAAGTIFVNDDVSDGLAAHWKFDETGATTALDFVGTNDAALQGAASISNASLPTLAVPDPGSLALNGTTDYAQIDAPTGRAGAQHFIYCDGLGAAGHDRHVQCHL